MSGPRRISHVQGRAIVLPGQDIDTDRIIPARFLKAVTFEGLDANVFADDRRQIAEAGGVHAFDAPGARDARVLIVGGNFGCGSSREHAPRAIRQWGITAVLGVSFAEIFYANAAAIGLPCVTAAPADLGRLVSHLGTEPSAPVSIDLERLEANVADLTIPIAMPAMGREAFLTGQWDATGLLLEDYDEVAARAATIPYLNHFA